MMFETARARGFTECVELCSGVCVDWAAETSCDLGAGHWQVLEPPIVEPGTHVAPCLVGGAQLHGADERFRDVVLSIPGGVCGPERS
jgi:hypothetical protein